MLFRLMAGDAPPMRMQGDPDRNNLNFSRCCGWFRGVFHDRTETQVAGLNIRRKYVKPTSKLRSSHHRMHGRNVPQIYMLESVGFDNCNVRCLRQTPKPSPFSVIVFVMIANDPCFSMAGLPESQRVAGQKPWDAWRVALPDAFSQSCKSLVGRSGMPHSQDGDWEGNKGSLSGL